jgi:hypothetical protein
VQSSETKKLAAGTAAFYAACSLVITLLLSRSNATSEEIF